MADNFNKHTIVHITLLTNTFNPYLTSTWITDVTLSTNTQTSTWIDDVEIITRAL